jgi:hypothetical protein
MGCRASRQIQPEEPLKPEMPINDIELHKNLHVLNRDAYKRPQNIPMVQKTKAENGTFRIYD